MTPMVDLGFLLITFFVFTTKLSESTAMQLYMPSDKRNFAKPPLLKESMALTLLLDGDNTIYYYHGDPRKAVVRDEIRQTNYSITNGIGAVIREKQALLDNEFQSLGGRNEMMVLIKPTSNATYKNTVDALDEMLINAVKRYAILEISNEERQAIARH